MTHAEEMDLTEIHWRLSEALKVGDVEDKLVGAAQGIVGRCKRGEDLSEKQEALARRLVECALVGPLTEDEVAEVTHQSKSRLERVAEAVVLALKRLRCGERPDADLALAFRDELGPTERLFIAGAALLALDPAPQAGLAEATLRDASQGLTDMQAFTVVCHQAAIKQARKGGDEAKARELEHALRRLEEKWAEADHAA